MEPSDPIIKVTVPKCDGEIEVFNVHQGVLCKSSRFFRNAMKPEWANSREHSDVISLPDDNARTVNEYVKWLYTGGIPKKLYETGENASQNKAKKAEQVFVLLAEGYVFGEKILDVKYKNAVIVAIGAAKASWGWNLGPESVDIVYEGTSSGSPLRRLIAESIAHLAHDDAEAGVGWMEFIDAYPREALVDAMKAMVRIRPAVTYLPIAVGESFLEEE